MSVRVMLLSFATLCGIALWGLGVYGEGAVAGNVAPDGYGVSTAINAPS